MGLSLFHVSSNVCDKPAVVERTVEKIKTISIPSPPNPNPLNYKIINYSHEGRFLVVLIEYPDCTNYEGKKILVYEGIYNIETLLSQKNY